MTARQVVDEPSPAQDVLRGGMAVVYPSGNTTAILGDQLLSADQAPQREHYAFVEGRQA